ncbi:MAG TPA: type II toxin-antitoxin system HipA family toxin [Candidatus Obscuribacterales bacterium]
MKSNILSVRLYGIPIGTLLQTQEGKMRFEYCEGAKHALSLSMPLTKRKYGNVPCEAYFGGLLPESEEARRAIGRILRANPNSTFSLLQAIGNDCAGAVSLHTPDVPVEADTSHEMGMKPLSDTALAQHIRELPQKPLFIGVEGLRLSLAGVQEKAAVCMINGRIGLPIRGTPTTHILKPAIDRYPGSVPNEYLCLKVAKALGLPVPNAEIRRAEDQVYLLVERYDRSVDEGKGILRLHQEDFCQALGVKEKYQRYGGPTLRDCFDLLLNSSLPVVDRNILMQAVVFNFLIGNADAHGKNFAMLYDSHGKARLAPFYDILCTQVYEDLSTEMCMKIGESYDFMEVAMDDWEKLCYQTGFSFPVLKRMMGKMSDEISTALVKERAQLGSTEFDTDLADKMVAQVERNRKRLIRMLR